MIILQVLREAKGVSEVLDVPLYRAGDTIPMDKSLSNTSEDDGDNAWETWNSHGDGVTAGISVDTSPEVALAFMSRCA